MNSRKVYLLFFSLLLSSSILYSGCSKNKGLSSQPSNSESQPSNPESQPSKPESPKKKEVAKEMIDLHGFDEAAGKKNIDLLLEKVPTYRSDCKASDFTFKGRYANFILTEINKYDDHDMICAYYRLKTNTNEDDYDANVTVIIYESQAASLKAMSDSTETYAAPEIYPSSLKVGDFAIGDEYYINYIRGNVYVNVMECPHDEVNEVSIIDLAKEIDFQILEIINRR